MTRRQESLAADAAEARTAHPPVAAAVVAEVAAKVECAVDRTRPSSAATLLQLRGCCGGGVFRLRITMGIEAEIEVGRVRRVCSDPMQCTDRLWCCRSSCAAPLVCGCRRPWSHEPVAPPEHEHCSQTSIEQANIEQAEMVRGCVRASSATRRHSRSRWRSRWRLRWCWPAAASRCSKWAWVWWAGRAGRDPGL